MKESRGTQLLDKTCTHYGMKAGDPITKGARIANAQGKERGLLCQRELRGLAAWEDTWFAAVCA